MERKLNTIFLILGLIGTILTASVLFAYLIAPNKTIHFMIPSLPGLELTLQERINEYKINIDITKSEKEKILYKKLISDESALLFLFKNEANSFIKYFSILMFGFFAQMTFYSCKLNKFLKNTNKNE